MLDVYRREAGDCPAKALLGGRPTAGCWVLRHGRSHRGHSVRCLHRHSSCSGCHQREGKLEPVSPPRAQHFGDAAVVTLQTCAFFSLHQVGNFIHYLSTFLAGLVVGFVSAWRLALLSVAVIPGIAFAGGLYAYTLTSLTSKSRDSYANAGIIAEQVRSLSSELRLLFCQRNTISLLAAKAKIRKSITFELPQ